MKVSVDLVFNPQGARAAYHLANLWTVRRKRIGSARREGFQKNNLHASYVHLYFPASQAVLRAFMNKTGIAAL